MHSLIKDSGEKEVRKPFAIAFSIIICTAGCARSHTFGHRAAGAPQIDASGLVPRVHFSTASAEVQGRGMDAIGTNAKWMHENIDAVLVLEGHCDERGTEEFNLELGDRRARSVMGEMMARGVDPERLIVFSKGEGEPIDPRHAPASWRKNRRVEFIIR